MGGHRLHWRSVCRIRIEFNGRSIIGYRAHLSGIIWVGDVKQLARHVSLIGDDGAWPPESLVNPTNWGWLVRRML